jgi:putative flippase GtrA
MTGEVSNRAGRAPTTHVRFLRFLVAAGLSVPVNLGSRVIFSLWMPFEWALLASHLCGMLTAYALTKIFVFERSGAPAHVELTRFAAVNVVSAAITWIVAVGLVRFVFPMLGVAEHPQLIAHVIGLSVSSVASFFGHRDFSFRRQASPGGFVRTVGRPGSPPAQHTWMTILFVVIVLVSSLRAAVPLALAGRLSDIFQLGAYTRAVLGFNYFELGAIRRGLGGSIVYLLSPDILVGTTVFFHLSAFAVCVGSALLFARLALPWPQRLAFGVAMAAIMLRWAEDIGRTDMAIAALLAAATLAVLRGRLLAAVLFVCVGLFIHELSVIFGIPLIAALMADGRLDKVGTNERWAVVLAVAIAAGLYLALMALPSVDVPTMVRVVRSKFAPSVNVDWAIYFAVSGARGLALNFCQNRLDAAFGVHVTGGVLVIACTAVALGEPARRKWAPVATIAIAPFIFMTVVANDMARWALLACFNVWLFACAQGVATRSGEQARLLPLAASLALLVLLEADFDRGDTLIHKPSPILERAAQVFAHKYTMRFGEVLQRCDPAWRDVLTDDKR